MAEATRQLGLEASLIVHGQDGLDEISPVATTDACCLQNGEIRSIKLSPNDFGFDALATSDIAPAENMEEAAALIQEAISDPQSKRFLAVLPNAAAALVVSGHATSWEHGAALAREAVENGKASRLLEQLKVVSHAE